MRTDADFWKKKTKRRRRILSGSRSLQLHTATSIEAAVRPHGKFWMLIFIHFYFFYTFSNVLVSESVYNLQTNTRHLPARVKLGAKGL